MDRVSSQSKALVESLSEVITATRKKLGISKNELAARSGLSATHIGYIEHGKRVPTIESLKRIAIGLETTAQRLIQEAEEVD